MIFRLASSPSVPNFLKSLNGQTIDSTVKLFGHVARTERQMKLVPIIAYQIKYTTRNVIRLQRCERYKYRIARMTINLFLLSLALVARVDSTTRILSPLPVPVPNYTIVVSPLITSVRFSFDLSFVLIRPIYLTVFSLFSLATTSVRPKSAKSVIDDRRHRLLSAYRTQ